MSGPRRLPLYLGLTGWIGVVVLLAFAVVVVAAPLLTPHAPTARVGLPYLPPSPMHPLGTDDVGKDLMANLLYGTRTSLAVGLGVAVLATAVGGVIGAFAALAGGWVGNGLMRIVDLVLVVPFLPLLITVAAFAGRSTPIQVVLIAGLLWARPARIVRAQALSARSHGYVEAAEAMGASMRRMVLRHLSHDVGPLLIPVFVRAAMVAVLLESTLAFLGLGDPLRASWGTMLYWANVRSVILTDGWLWWVIPPGMAIAVLVIALGLVGLAVEERLNPVLGGEMVAARG